MGVADDDVVDCLPHQVEEGGYMDQFPFYLSPQQLRGFSVVAARGENGSLAVAAANVPTANRAKTGEKIVGI